MTFEQLKNKASTLPYLPGVYVMRGADASVIYVGKAKKLRNRVSQYFHDTASHSYKTKTMVRKIFDFDVIVCSSEFEALVLECSLIKQHKPKYNILLKDDKGFPYLRIDMRETCPKIQMVSKIQNDGAEYFGPFGSRSATKAVLETIIKALKLPVCNKSFPRDCEKSRPCLNYHLNHCQGWCQAKGLYEEYLQRIAQARQLLMGHYKAVAGEIKEKMLIAAEELNFELAAKLRDQLSAVELLQTKQIVTNGKNADLDVVGFAQTEVKACFSVLHFVDGKLADKEYEILDSIDDAADAISSLVKQFYLTRGFAPKTVLLPIKMPDSAVFSQMLEQEHKIKTRFLVPQRGENMQLIKLAQTNAQEEADRVSDWEDRTNKTLQLLARMLKLESVQRIESYDISNISGTDIVGSMVVFMNGKSRRSEYKRFQVNDLDGQDDYASMRQVVTRRFKRFLSGDSGFNDRPDLVLIDGGINHAKIVEEVLQELDIAIPVFGMVKDDRHRTRALVNSTGEEIRIDAQQSVFSLVGNIQEETHRFAITYHKKLRSKRLRYSELDQIDGVGPKRKQELLKMFKSITAISGADMQSLERVLPKQIAKNVYNHFRNQ